MPISTGWPAPAKINLFLHVTGRRRDGYHLLQTVFQFLDVGDELSFEIGPGDAIGRVNAVPGLAAGDDRQSLTGRGAVGIFRGLERRPVMKIVNSLKSAKKRERNCRVIRRRGRVYVINKRNPRFKARQG